MKAKEVILELINSLPDATTYAEPFDRLRPLYYRDVAPIIAQYDQPPRPLGTWRRDITGSVEAQEQTNIWTSRDAILGIVEFLPSDASPAEAVDEAMYRLVLSYSYEKAIKQTAEDKGIPHEDVRQQLALWRA